MLCVFFFNDTATTEIYTLSLHDALPISALLEAAGAHRSDVLDRVTVLQEKARKADIVARTAVADADELKDPAQQEDRKSTRLNSSHANISYAVFCLKKKNRITITRSSTT